MCHFSFALATYESPTKLLKFQGLTEVTNFGALKYKSGGKIAQ